MHHQVFGYKWTALIQFDLICFDYIERKRRVGIFYKIHEGLRSGERGDKIKLNAAAVFLLCFLSLLLARPVLKQAAVAAPGKLLVPDVQVRVSLRFRVGSQPTT